MESLYSQVVDVLISIGDINTLAALWKEISYVPSLHYLKDLINKSVPEIANILSIQVPKLKIVDWRSDSNDIPFINLDLDIYNIKCCEEEMHFVVDTDLFIKLVNYYDAAFILQLIGRRNYNAMINFLVNNRRRSNRFLKILLRSLNVIKNTDNYKIGSLFYWSLIGNKDLEKNRVYTESLSIIIPSDDYVSRQLFFEGFIQEAVREENYYPTFAVKFPNYVIVPLEIRIFLATRTQEDEIYQKNIEKISNILNRMPYNDVIQLCLNEGNMTEEDKALFALMVAKDTRNCNINNLHLINYDRVFHTCYVLNSICNNLNVNVANIIDKYDIDFEYNPYEFYRKYIVERVRTYINSKLPSIPGCVKGSYCIPAEKTERFNSYLLFDK